MASKNQVTLTFAGETKQIESAFQRVGSGAEQMEGRLDKAGSGAARFQQGLGAGSRSTEDYAKGLDRLEESGGTAETRFLGLGAGISGTSALMQGGKLDAEGMAMAFADLGDFTEHTLAPAMRGVKDRVGGAIASFKEGGGASEFFKRNLASIAAGAVVAGGAIALLTMHFTDNAKRAEESKQRAQDWADRLDELGGNVTSLTSDIVANDEEFDGLRSRMNEVGVSTDEVTAAFERNDGSLENLLQTEQMSKSEKIALMQEVGKLTTGVEGATDAYGDNTHAQEENNAETARAKQLYGELAPITEEATEGIRGFSDAIDVLLGRTLGVQEAQDNLAQAVIEAGAHFTEQTENFGNAGLALSGNTEAAIANREEMRGLVEDGVSLIQTMQEQGASSAELRAEQGRQIGIIRDLQERYGWTDAQVAAYIETVNGIPISKGTTIHATDNATWKIENIRAVINTLPRTHNIDVSFRTGVIPQILYGGAATGGVVPQYLATGGIGRPRGTDTVPAMLTPGEMVLTDAQQGQLWAMANGRGGGAGTNVTINVSGSLHSDRDLVRVIRDEFDRGGFGGRR